MDDFNCDTLMLNVYHCLRQDMRTALRTSGCSVSDASTAGNCLEAIRQSKYLLHDGLTVYQYKWCTQINTFLKRYTFKNDVITPAEREELTNVKFSKLQASLAQNYWRPRSTRCHEVLREARSIVRQVLDGFCPQGLAAEGRFGTKATVGCPASSAYLDEKLIARPITGSAVQLEWLDSLRSDDKMLDRILQGASYRRISKLAQVNVPKKCDIDRGINPNTLVGSLYSSALGDILTEALRNEGLDIAILQSLHAQYAYQASKTRQWVTADLSDASHGFLSNLLNALLPRVWYRAVMYGIIRNVEVAGVVSRLESIMTMGIGFTFPMQTLLFYCLLKALSNLTGINGLISVYGDDLIYPRKLHPYVVGLFSDLGFKLNLDKTFVESYFRESCGADFFRGVDVRPYSPEESYHRMGGTEYAAFCYKLLNGLERKWYGCEIPITSALLKFEICRVKGSLFVVPKHFPDHAGWKVAHSEYSYAPPIDDCWLFPIAKWFYCSETGQYEYPLISKIPERHYVAHMAPYYWETLRSFAQRERFSPDRRIARFRLFKTDLAFYTVNIHDLPPVKGQPTLKWASGPFPKRYVRCMDGTIRRRKYASVASKDDTKARYTVNHASKLSAYDEEYAP